MTRMTIPVEPELTLRDYFAACALQGLLTNPVTEKSSLMEDAVMAYQLADAMLEAREKSFLL